MTPSSALRAIVIACCLFPLSGLAATSPEDAGTVKSVKGVVTIISGAGQRLASPGDTLRSADQVRTGPHSAVGITLRDNTVLSVGPDSTLSLDKFTFDATTRKGALEASLKRGSMSGISGTIAKTSPNAVQFKTATMTMGVRGTEFIIEAGQGQE